MGSVKKNIFLNTLLSASQVIYPLVTFPYASRIIGPSGIGAVAFVDSVTQYLILIAALGIPIYGVREVAKCKGDQLALNKLFTELVSVHLVMSLICGLFYIGAIVLVPRFHEHINLFIIGCAILVMMVFPVEWFFQGLEKFNYIAKRTLIIRFASVISLFFLVRKQEDMVWYYGINLIVLIVNAAINLTNARNYVSLSFVGFDYKKHLKPLFYIVASHLAISIYILMDSVMLGFLSQDENVGYYSLSVRINKIFLAVIAAFATAIIPRIAMAYSQNDLDMVKRLLSKSFDYIMFMTIPICAGIFILSPELTRIFAGEKFMPAVLTMRIMSPLTLVIGLSNLFGMQILTTLGKERLVFRTVLVGMCISLALNLILIPKFSQNGAAVTNLFTEVVVTCISFYYARKSINIIFNWHLFMKSLLACLLFVPITLLVHSFVRENIWLQVSLTVVACMVLYFIIQLYWFKNAFAMELYAFAIKKIRHGKV